MSEAAGWQWTVLIAWAVIPIPSLLLAGAGINILVVGALLILWLALPSVGAWVYLATWLNLIGWRLIGLRGGRLGATPMSVRNQNGMSSWLVMLGIVGAVRSGLAGDGIGIALGVIGAVVLFMVQGPLFRSASS